VFEGVFVLMCIHMYVHMYVVLYLLKVRYFLFQEGVFLLQGLACVGLCPTLLLQQLLLLLLTVSLISERILQAQNVDMFFLTRQVGPTCLESHHTTVPGTALPCCGEMRENYKYKYAGYKTHKLYVFTHACIQASMQVCRYVCM
jgi:hypothetical protein